MLMFSPFELGSRLEHEKSVDKSKTQDIFKNFLSFALENHHMGSSLLNLNP